MYGKLVLTAVFAAFCGMLVGTYWGCSRDSSARRGVPDDGRRALLIVHGGAGVLNEAEMREAGTRPEDYENALADALRAGYWALREGTSVDGVEAAVRSMEDCGRFNAGKGAALNREGKARHDAAIMEGKMAPPESDQLLGKRDPRRRAGAVGDLRQVKNPIAAARAVMEMPGSRHALLVGEDAMRFVLSPSTAERYRLEKMPEDYFITPWRRLQQEKAQQADQKRFGTVGAVACKGGTLAVATSTGGLADKFPGRVGDTALIGAGSYADDRACAVSGTGTGEMFIRHAIAYDVVARMLYSSPRPSVAEAARQTIDSIPEDKGGIGAVIALDPEGRFTFALSRELPGTYRGYVTREGRLFVGIGRGELKAVGMVGEK